MIKKSKKINEGLKFRALSAEEKQKKGILGRLYGPVASFAAPTRNGRLYSDELWGKLLQSPLVKERFANGGIFGELCHPDYEEVDMNKVACIMPEPPKKDASGLLMGYVDIVDTPCGKVAYQLAKYGYKFGISSRGTGDVIDGPDGEQVDPDTYQLNAFDLVEIPAVEAARLQFTEELSAKKRYNKSLTEALAETIENEKNKDSQRIMIEALDEFGFEVDPEEDKGKDIQMVSDKNPDKGVNQALGAAPAGNTATAVNASLKNTKNSPKLFEELDEEELEVEDDLEAEGEFEPVEDDFDVDYSEEEEDDFDSIYGDEELEEPGIQSRNDRVTNPHGGELLTEEGDEETSDEDKPREDIVVEETEAGNAGEVIEQLQTALRRVSVLEKDNLRLKEKLSVCNAKETNAGSQLAKYKQAVATLSESVKQLKNSNSRLTEQLAVKEDTIRSNTEKFANFKSKYLDLQEQLLNQQEAMGDVNTLTKQLTEANERLAKVTTLARKYQKELKESKAAYISAKADALGVSREEVSQSLTEAYSLRDVDRACESLSEHKQMLRKLPFWANEDVKISVSKQNEGILNESYNTNDDDDITSLLRITGL